MCLLIHAPAGTKFTHKQVADFYARNQDGVGVMYARRGMLYYDKILPKKVDEIVKFLRQTEGVERCIHFRMQTHGLVDMENCHPYIVSGYPEKVGGFGTHEDPLLLMHNGMLSTGNRKDAARSDTWHYIRDYLRPMLAKQPDLMMLPEFIEVLGAHIGSGNKFAIMNTEGKVAIVNKSSGVMHEGVWYSNTYAWSAPRSLTAPSWRGRYNSLMYEEYDDYHVRATTVGNPVGKVSPFPTAENSRKRIDKRQRQLAEKVIEGTQLALTPREKLEHEVDVVDFLNDLSLAAPKAHGLLSEGAVDRAFRTAGINDMWKLLEEYAYVGRLTTKEFVELVIAPTRIGTALALLDDARSSDLALLDEDAEDNLPDHPVQ